MTRDHEIKKLLDDLVQDVLTEIKLLDSSGAINHEFDPYVSSYLSICDEVFQIPTSGYFSFENPFSYKLTMDEPSRLDLTLWGCETFPSTLNDLFSKLLDLQLRGRLFIFHSSATTPIAPSDFIEVLYLSVSVISDDISQFFPMLHTLVTYYCWKMDEDLTLSLPHLVNLHVEFPRSSFDSTFTEYERSLVEQHNVKPLRSLDLSACPTLKTLVIDSPEVRQLHLPASSFRKIELTTPHLQELKTSGTVDVTEYILDVKTFTPEFLSNINPTDLTIYTRGNIPQFKDMPSLTSLYISARKPINISRTSFPALTSLSFHKMEGDELVIESPCLTKVVLDECRIKNVVIKNSVNLQSIHVRGRYTSITVIGTPRLEEIDFLLNGDVILSIAESARGATISVETRGRSLSLSVPPEASSLSVTDKTNRPMKNKQPPVITLSGGEGLQEVTVKLNGPSTLVLSDPLSSLKKLHVSVNSECHIPEWLSDCHLITDLRLSGKPVHVPNISGLRNLKNIHLFNPVMPVVEYELPEIEYARTEFSHGADPGTVQLMKSLKAKSKYAVFSSNKDIPLELLRELYISHCEIKISPESHDPPLQWWIVKLSSLYQDNPIPWEELLNLASALLKLLPDEFPFMHTYDDQAPPYMETRHEREFRMSDPKVIIYPSGDIEVICDSRRTDTSPNTDWLVPGYIPLDMAEVRKLRHVHISNCNLLELPPALLTKPGLRQLAATDNHISTIPPELFQQPSLTDVLLSNNQIRELPDIPQGCQIQNLALDSNLIATLPDSVRNLKKLVELDIAGNQISSLPSGLTELPELKKLHLDSSLREDPVVKQLEEKGVELEFYTYC